MCVFTHEREKKKKVTTKEEPKAGNALTDLFFSRLFGEMTGERFQQQYATTIRNVNKINNNAVYALHKQHCKELIDMQRKWLTYIL